ncbi:MAG: T9SS type A sorting domain-containing protein [Saprospiraceae bacterium]|nr:T9SS type A sorting domain-containing protein [Saprospiraceae bacterium]
MPFDEDCDGDLDLLIGDIANDKMIFLRNGGTKTDAWITAQDGQFPSYDTSIDIPIFLASFYLDVNNDGKRDLIVTPNETDGGRNTNHIWLYLNEGTDCDPDFILYSKSFLVDNMISVGAKSDPAVGDISGDGLPDLLVGSNGIYTADNQKESRIFYYRNTGTRNIPEFTLISDDYLTMSSLTSFPTALSPNLVDMDGDGDLDLMIGEGNGQLYFFTNVAGPGAEASFSYVYPYKDIFVGQDAKPELFDVNNDGVIDLLMGEQNNELNLFMNRGTSSNPDFPTVPDTRNFGSLFTVTDFYTFNNSPVFFKQEGSTLCYIGFEDGRLSLYEWLPSSGAGKLQLIESNAGHIRHGFKLTTEIADIDHDGFLDLVLGNFAGGLTFFHTPYRSDVVSVKQPENDRMSVQLYPNPASELLTIVSPEVMDFTFTNVIGNIVMTGKLKKDVNHIELTVLRSGVYHIKLIDNIGRFTHLQFIKL